MALYSELKSVEEQTSLSPDNISDSEDNRWLSDTVRWSQIPYWRAWKASFKQHWPAILIHLGLLAINILIVTVYASKGSLTSKCDMNPILDQNPLRKAITYEARRFELQPIYGKNGTVNSHKPQHFTGPPRPELENAWETLMNSKYSEVRVSKEELGEFENDETIVKLSDGSGYYVTISGFHGLHCVRRLHKYIWADTYYPDLSEHDAFLLKMHTEHCLDWLRQYVQCHADPTLGPVHWTNVDSIPVSTDVGNRMCASWEPIKKWMAEHSFDPFEPGLLVHPLFGVPGTIKDAGKFVETGVHE